ncbi:MAG: efflux RND transporter permease subunit [Alphaproteobacteria bacterium]
MFVALDDFKKRHGHPELSAEAISGELIKRSFQVSDASVFFIAPPPVQGLGNGGGFKMMIQDRSGAGYKALEGATGAMMGAAYTTPNRAKGRHAGLQPVQYRLAARRARSRSQQGAIARRLAD